MDTEERHSNRDASQDGSLSSSELVTKKSNREAKPGIIYLSRIPPMMRPQRVKKIFAKYGEIGRVFLQPEDKFQRKKRKKRSGCKAKLFTEGWVEFMDKRIAKSIAVTFNNTPIDSKKRSRYYEDLWNIKYLHRFQWAHLAERLEYERQVRQQRIRTEISQAKRETNFYMQSVEISDKLNRIEKKKREKGKEWIARVRTHKQRVTQEEHSESQLRRSGKVTKDTLSKVFKKKDES